MKDGKNYFTKKALSNGLKQGKPNNGSSHIRNLIEGWSSKLRDGAKRAIWTLRSLLGKGFVDGYCLLEALPSRFSGKDMK